MIGDTSSSFKVVEGDDFSLCFVIARSVSHVAIPEEWNNHEIATPLAHNDRGKRLAITQKRLAVTMKLKADCRIATLPLRYNQGFSSTQ
jgi:hypothetical protein